MARAVWNGIVIAESDAYEVVEGNLYFPLTSVRQELLKPSGTHTTCPWKGRASYYSVQIDGVENKDAAWYYPAPSKAAENIKDHVAFGRGVDVEK